MWLWPWFLFSFICPNYFAESRTSFAFQADVETQRLKMIDIVSGPVFHHLSIDKSWYIVRRPELQRLCSRHRPQILGGSYVHHSARSIREPQKPSRITPVKSMKSQPRKSSRKSTLGQTSRKSSCSPCSRRFAKWESGWADKKLNSKSIPL